MRVHPTLSRFMKACKEEISNEETVINDLENEFQVLVHEILSSNQENKREGK